MRGGYDLYGNYYPDANDALNADMVQKMDELERQLHEQQQPSNEEEIHYLWQKIQQLEERIAILEGQF